MNDTFVFLLWKYLLAFLALIIIFYFIIFLRIKKKCESGDRNKINLNAIVLPIIIMFIIIFGSSIITSYSMRTGFSSQRIKMKNIDIMNIN